MLIVIGATSYLSHSLTKRVYKKDGKIEKIPSEEGRKVLIYCIAAFTIVAICIRIIYME
jgi:hypothetical protein